MKKLALSVLILIYFNSLLFAQQRKQLTVEDIWAKGSLWARQIPGFNWIDDNTYCSLADKSIIKSSVLTGEVTGVIFKNKEGLDIDDYFFNEDKTKLILVTETEQIYRHSIKAIYYLFDIKTNILKKISEEKIAYVTLSPDGEKLAYTKENNLFFTSVLDMIPVAITKDGEINKIINGETDWVYEEEFSVTKTFFWSPDSKKIAFLKFDESQVKEYTLQLWNSLYPENYKYKYPKAGEKNSTVSVHCYWLDNKSTKAISVRHDRDTYIPRLSWTQNPNIVSIQTLNRLQNHYQIFNANVSTSEIKKIYEEQNNTYIEITDDLTYLKDGKHFLITSEKDGFKHLYKYTLEGTLVSQITKGPWEVDKISGIDEKNGLVFYTSTETSPLERQLYSIHFDGNKKKRLTDKKGTHEIELSPGFKYFVDTYSSLNIPYRFSIHIAKSGQEKKVFEDNAALKQTMESFQIFPAEFFSFKTPDSIELNGYVIKPSQLDPQKKYPVLLFVYGGPGYQSVSDSWKGPNYFWFQMLAEQGYIIVSIDNRGTGGRGAEFKKITQNVLGKYETEDVINTAKYLQSLPYIDKNRIGIFGWSFGGYLSSLAMTLGSDYFKAGIAVAPVTSWRFYDTIYTERYLGLPSQNPEGYDLYSPISHASRLKGNYLLIHGTADDNVHVQNSMMMEDALIKANKQFEVFYYPDKNHGIYGGVTRLHLYKMMSDFIFRKL